MPKELLIEYQVFQPMKAKLMESQLSPSGNMVVSGQVQACDKPNANKRIYPYETLYRQVEKYVQGPIAENRALGELDHPESTIINLKNVSHNIVKLWWQGKDLYGTIEILPTPSGNILKELFKNNIAVGISSRAIGSVTPIGEGLVQVEDDLDLICWDFVSTPSTYGAYMRAIVGGSPEVSINESLDRSQDYKFSKANIIISDILCTLGDKCCIR